MRYIFVLILISALKLTSAQEMPIAPDFSRYVQTESFQSYLRWQINAAEHLQQRNLVAISAFPSGDRFALQYVVTERGQERDLRNVYNWAIQASHGRQLLDAELKELRSAIEQLPNDNKLPPLERLVILSFRNNMTWVTRSYDSGALPTAMRRIYEIIGERFESKNER
jgi:hypothetical protein